MPDFPLKSYELLVDCIKAILQSQKLGDKEINTDYLYTVIGILAEEHKHSFPRDVAENVASLLSQSLSKLDISSLSLFSHLSPHISQEYITNLLVFISQSIIEYIKSNPVDFEFPVLSESPQSTQTETENVTEKTENKEKHITWDLPNQNTEKQVYTNERGERILPPVSFKEVTFQVSETKTFPNGLDLRPNITLRSKINFEDLISNEYHARLSLLFKPMRLHQSNFYMTLNPMLEHVEKNPNNDETPMIFFAILFLAIHANNKEKISDNFFKVILNSPFFDDRITIFDSIENFDAIDSFRNAFTELVIETNSFAQPSVIDISRTPKLLIEFIHRIIRDLQMIQYDNIQYIVRFIMTISLYYQELDYEKQSDEIENARASIFLLISHILSQEEGAKKFYSSTYFTTFFASLIFEDALREYVLTNIRNYIINPQNTITEELMSIIAHLLTVCFSNFEVDSYLLITYDLLQTLNEILQHIRSSTELFEKFRRTFFPPMSKLTNTELCQIVLLQCIQFFALTSSYKLLDQAQLTALEECIETVFDKQCPQQLWVKIIQLIATDITPSVTPSFFIRQPDAVKLFLRISSKSDKSIEVIDFIRQLVRYSPQNAQVCHEYDVDIYVLDTLKEKREDTSPDETVALLKLFHEIAMEVSSSAVVQRYVSLFTPIKGQYMPKFQDMYMHSLNQMVSASTRLPVSYMTLTQDSMTVEVTGLTQAHFNDGFSIAFWAYIDTARAQYKPMICQFTDSHNRKLTWFFSAASLFCTQRGETYESTGRVEMDDIPNQQWNLFVLTYTTDQFTSTMQTTINCKSVEPLDFKTMKFYEGPVQCTIGGVLPDSSQSDKVSRLGTFALFPVLSAEQIGSLYESGPRALGDIPAKPAFYLAVSGYNHKLCVKTVAKSPEIEYNLSNVNLRSPLSFIGALVTLCKVEILIPLFALFDMRTSDGFYFLNFPKQVIECFGNLFTMSKTAQYSFHWGRGFSIVSHLMLSVSRANMRYSLYKQFFQMMQSITVPELQDDIFIEILLNVDIWGRCDPVGHISVLRHWARILLPSYKSIMAKVFPFKRALSILRLYYWYQPNESPQILGVENRLTSYETENPLQTIEAKTENVLGISPSSSASELQQQLLSSPSTLNITEARRLLQSIALTVSSVRFQLDDFTHLQSHCITCCDDEQVAEILWMLLQLGLATPSPLSGIQADFTSFIFTLLTRNNAKIFRFALNIFCVFARKKLSNPQMLEEQLLFASHIMQSSIMTPVLLNKIIKMIQGGFYELVPIAFSIAQHNHEIDLLLSSIIPSTEVSKHVSFALVPIFVARASTEDEIDKILSFLIKSSLPQNWETIYATIDFLGNVLDENLTLLKRKLLFQILDILSDENYAPSPLELQTFFKLARFFIFFRDTREQNESLQLFYEDSPFFSYYAEGEFLSSSTNTSDQTSDSSEPNINSSPHSKRVTRKVTQSLSSINESTLIKRENSHTLLRMNSDSKLVDQGQNQPQTPKKAKSFKHKLVFPHSPDEFCKEKPNFSDIVDQISKQSVPRTFFTFGLRLETENVLWEDADFALKASDLFLKYKNSDFVSTDILVCAFLVHYHPENVVSHMKGLKISEDDRQANISYIHLLNYHMMKCNMKPIPGYPIEKAPDFCLLAFNRFLQQHDSEVVSAISSTHRALQTFISQNARKMVNTFSLPSDDLISESLASVGNVIDDILYHRQQNGRKWSTLWRYLAVDRAPWNYIPADQAHFKRDNTACALFCPVKLKRNLSFDPHKSVLSAPANQRRINPPDSNSPTNLLNSQSTKRDRSFPLMEMLQSSSQSEELEQLAGYDPSYIEYKCLVLEPHREREATFLVSRKLLRIVFQDKKKFYKLSDVVHLFFRRRLHRPDSIEIFLISGKSYFLQFPSVNSLEILSKLSQLPLPNIKTLQTRDFFAFFQQSTMTEKWLNNRVSNFEYIMHLNIMSGRTFNDLSQYPIFPWIFCDFESAEINTSDAEKFRDLSKPIGALGKERLNEILEQTKGREYLYESGPSGLLSVCLYLLRLEPFATMHVKLQKGQFDQPGRLFSSIRDTFEQVTKNMNDYRELIPEFFFMPEFLVNHNGFDLGETEKIGKIGDVVLPQWSKNAMDFVYLHRKILESDIVTTSLHNWIDLVWGCKQRDSAAVSNRNTFRPEMYDSIWSTNPPAEETEHIEDVLRHVGQIPPQLFRESHPQRIPNVTLNLTTITTPYTVTCKTANDVIASRIDHSNSGLMIRVSLFDGSGSLIQCNVDLSKAAASFSQNSTSSDSSSTSLVRPVERRLNNSVSTREFHRMSDDFPGSLPSKHGFFNSLMQSPLLESFSPEKRSRLVSRATSHGQDLLDISELDHDDFSVVSRRIRNFGNYKVKKGPLTTTVMRNSKFALISQETGRVVFLDTNTAQIEELTALHNDAVCIASDRCYFVVALQDSALCVFRDGELAKPLRTMPSYRDSIICCAISAAFFLVVMGTRDCNLIVNSLNKGGTVRVIDMEHNRPRQVLVTHGWGFIVVYSTKMVEGGEQHYISVFNVNGEPIRSTRIDSGIVAWDTWMSASGFDYMVFADTRGRLYSFEVFFLNISQNFFRCWSQVSSIKYIRDISTVVAVTDNGQIMFVPNEIEEKL